MSEEQVTPQAQTEPELATESFTIGDVTGPPPTPEPTAPSVDGMKLNTGIADFIAGLTMPFDKSGLFQRPRTKEEFTAALKGTLAPLLMMIKFHECIAYAALLPLWMRGIVGLALIAVFVFIYHPSFGPKPDKQGKGKESKTEGKIEGQLAPA